MINRKKNLQQLQAQDFDVVIIGGGINGAGTCRDLSLQGLKVALIDKGDFASGTSSASSKLAHGGIRYLEQGQIKLVRESCHERELLIRNAKHLVHPLPFLYPLYKKSKLKPWMLKIGLWAYDKLSGKLKLNPHKMIKPTQLKQLEPALNTEELTGCGLYYDAQMDDSRIVIENCIDSHEKGAILCNYVECSSIEISPTVTTLTCKDTQGQHIFKVKAKRILNATGPWSDSFLKQVNPLHTKKLRPSRGSHIIVPSFLKDHAVVLKAPKDGRVFFAIPWHSKTLIGTTDIDEHNSPDTSEISEEEISYLLTQIQTYFPNQSIQKEDIISTFSGIRPLVLQESKTVSSVSREEVYAWDGPILTLRGGKYTTYRHICENLSHKLCTSLNHPFTSQTKHLPLPGGNFSTLEELVKELQIEFKTLSPDLCRNLAKRYGSRAKIVIQHCTSLKNGCEAIQDTPYVIGELHYGLQTEFIQTAEDFIRRRTTLALEFPSEKLTANVEELMKELSTENS